MPECYVAQPSLAPAFGDGPRSRLSEQSQRVPEIYPFLAVKDVDAAVAFYARAFGATEERQRMIAPDGPQVRCFGSRGSASALRRRRRTSGMPSPETVGATTVRISLHVEDADVAQKPCGGRGGKRNVRGRRPALRVAEDAWSIHSGTSRADLLNCSID